MKKLLNLILITISATVAHSATVNWGVTGVGDSFIVDSTGAALAANSLVRIGFFSLTDSQILALAEPTPANISALNSSFVEWDSSRIGAGNGGAPGVFDKASSRLLSTFAPGGGVQLYMWFLKSTNNSSNALSISSGVQQAIVYRNKLNDPDWAVPTSDLAFPTNADTSDIGAPGGGLRSGSVVLAGNFLPNSSPGATFNGGPSSAIQLAASVPEPTSAFLVAVGAAGLMMRRRRQS